MSQKLDAIIIGAGHNGLVCANYLAKAGKSVLLLERSSQVGGLAAPCEFAPGFLSPVAHSANHFPAAIAEDLDLSAHGLKLVSHPLNMTALSADGRHVRIRGLELEGAGEEDREAYRNYATRMETFSAALQPSWNETMPRL